MAALSPRPALSVLTLFARVEFPSLEPNMGERAGRLLYPWRCQRPAPRVLMADIDHK